MSEDTGTESAESTESTDSSESAAAVQTQESAGQQEVAQEVKQDVPFHEHPRFKELVEQKNTYASESKQLKDAYQQLQSEISQLKSQYQPKAQKPSYDPLFKQLEQANPEFANLIKEQYEKAKTVDTLSERIAQQEAFIQNYQREQAVSQFDKLCEQNKVEPRFKSFYQAAVANEARVSGATLSELPNIFKTVHDGFAKTLDEYSRSITEKYTTQKTQDAKKPATQTGGIPPKPADKSAPPLSRDDVKRQLADAIRARNNS